MCGAELFLAGRGGAGRRWKSAGRSGAGRGKKYVNQLIQKFNKSAEIVPEGFVLQYGVLTKENITLSDSYMVFLQTR